MLELLNPAEVFGKLCISTLLLYFIVWYTHHLISKSKYDLY